MTEPLDPRSMDPALLRGLTQRRMSRRDLLKGVGAGAGVLGLSAFLAACGVSGTSGGTKTPTGSPSPDLLKKIYGDGTPAGQLNFANWEDYIDVTSKGKSPTLQKFTKDTGIKVTYKTVINDNDPFLAPIIQTLQSGGSTPYDLMVITNGGPVERMIRLGFLTPVSYTHLTLPTIYSV